MSSAFTSATERTTEITAYERSVALVKAELTQYKPKQIDTVLGLLQDGNTVPFIARYRKDQTGSLDEVQIREIEERQRYLENFEKRKEEISRLMHMLRRWLGDADFAKGLRAYFEKHQYGNTIGRDQSALEPSDDYCPHTYKQSYKT